MKTLQSMFAQPLSAYIKLLDSLGYRIQGKRTTKSILGYVRQPDLEMKRRALEKCGTSDTTPTPYLPSDKVPAFLDSL
jgi:hypothetical protein